MAYLCSPVSDNEADELSEKDKQIYRLTAFDKQFLFHPYYEHLLYPIKNREEEYSSIRTTIFSDQNINDLPYSLKDLLLEDLNCVETPGIHCESAASFEDIEFNTEEIMAQMDVVIMLGSIYNEYQFIGWKLNDPYYKFTDSPPWCLNYRSHQENLKLFHKIKKVGKPYPSLSIFDFNPLF